MRKLILFLITLYKRFISPYKRFSCAYRVHTARASCSTLGYRAIRRYGVWKGVNVIRERLEKCGIAHRRYSGRYALVQKQSGHCDLPCDISACDFPQLHPSDICDVLSNCSSCNCGDWTSRSKKTKDDEYVYIPPKVNNHDKR